jgi:hypothetical protein
MNELPCPVCGVRHTEKRPVIVDVCFCPRCGVPNFFPAGYFPMDCHRFEKIRCVHCAVPFNPPEGGGVIVNHPTQSGLAPLQVRTPRGVLHNRELIRS